MPAPRQTPAATAARLTSLARLAAKPAARRRTATPRPAAPDSEEEGPQDSTLPSAASNTSASTSAATPAAVTEGSESTTTTTPSVVHAPAVGRGGRGRRVGRGGRGTRIPVTSTTWTPANTSTSGGCTKAMSASTSDGEGDEESLQWRVPGTQENVLIASLAALFGWQMRSLSLSTDDTTMKVTLEHSVNPSYAVSIKAPLANPSIAVETGMRRRVSSAPTAAAVAEEPAMASPAPSAKSACPFSFADSAFVTVNGHRQMSCRECALWLSGQFSSGFASFPEPLGPTGSAIVATSAIPSLAVGAVEAASEAVPPVLPQPQNVNEEVERRQPVTTTTTVTRRGRPRKQPRTEDAPAIAATAVEGGNHKSDEDEHEEPAAPQLRRGRPRKVVATEATDTTVRAASRHSPDAVEPAEQASTPTSASTTTATTPSTHQAAISSSSSDAPAPPLRSEEEVVDHLSLLPRRRRAKRERTSQTRMLLDGSSGTTSGSDCDWPRRDGPTIVELTTTAPPRPPMRRRSAELPETESAGLGNVVPAAVNTAAVSATGATRRTVEGGSAPAVDVPATPTATVSVGSQTSKPPPSGRTLKAGATPTMTAGHGLVPVDPSQLRLFFIDTAVTSGAALLARTQAEGRHLAVDLAELVNCSKKGDTRAPDGNGACALPALLVAMQQTQDEEGAVRADMLRGVRLAVASGRLHGDTLEAGVHALGSAERERRRWTTVNDILSDTVAGLTPAFPREQPHAFLPVSGVALLQSQDRADVAGGSGATVRLGLTEDASSHQGGVPHEQRSSQPSYVVLPAGSVMPAAPRIAIDATYCLRGSLMVDTSVAMGEEDLPTLVVNPNSDLPDKIYRRFLSRDLREGVDRVNSEGLSSSSGVTTGGNNTATVVKAKQRTGRGATASDGSDRDGESLEDSDDGDAAMRKPATTTGAKPQPSGKSIDKLLKRDDEVIARVPMADVEWRYQA